MVFSRRRSPNRDCSNLARTTWCASGIGATARRASPACSIAKDKGASPLFSPVHRNEGSAKEALLHLVRRDPHELGFERSRWRLRDLLSRLSDWKARTTAGVQRILKRMNIHSKRGRSYIHSPDTHYQEKLARITVLRQRVKESQGREVLLYLDECSIERQPSVGYNYEAAGSDAPHAEWKPRYNTVTRIMATLDPLSGKVVSTLIGKVTTSALVSFYRKVRQAYPQAERIWIVQDNWPVHLHPDVLDALSSAVLSLLDEQDPTQPLGATPPRKSRCPSRSCSYRPMPPGVIPSRSSGAGSSRT